MTSVVPTFKQGDSATLKFKIFDDGKKFDLAAFTRAEITFKLPSGQTIVGEPYIDVNTQMIVYNFVGLEMNEAGKLTTILSIYSGTSMVSIQPFSIFIFNHLKDKDLSYIGILQDLIAEVQLLNEEVKSTLFEANNLKDELNNVLIEANNAEQIRNTNEQNRITSENTRNFNESARQQNELDRKNAESIRESNEATRIQNEQNRQNEFDNKINEAEEAITDTKNATDEANKAADSIKGWGQATVWNSTTTYSKNNVVTYNGSTWQSKGDNNHNSIPSETNTNWILLALRGVDGTGAVSTVNGKSPDGAGNVELTADEIGTYTQQQIDDKDTTVKEYFTDKGIGDKVIVISEQDYIDANYNGMFWVKNDALDFLPTETDHVATLLVYENPDNGNIVKIFNVINPTTAISYMRTYTYDNSSVLIHDSGWIEGGGGSGGGGGNVNITSYPLITDRESQTIWEIPTGIYNQVTDTVMVFHNTVFLDSVSYTLTNNRISIHDNPHTVIDDNNLVIVVFRNMPNMQVELDGNNIIDGSIHLDKLGQDVHDAMSDANNSWQKGVYNDTDITNLGKKTVTRTFHLSAEEWISSVNVENFYILIPVVNFSGVIKVTYVTSGAYSVVAGGAEVIHNIAKYDGVLSYYSKEIISISPSFAKDYFVGNIDYNTTGISLPLYKAPVARNPITVKVEIIGTYDTLFDDMKNATSGCVDAGSPTAHGYQWIPQHSQIPTYDLMNKWNAGYDAYTRFQGECRQITDWNLATQNGMYMGQNVANAPSTDWWMGTTITHNDSYIVQKVIGVTDGRELERQKYNGIWENWIETSPRKLFQSVSNGKQGLASAITGKGVPTDANDSFPTMINNINQIPTGSRKANGVISSSSTLVTFTYKSGGVVSLAYLDLTGLSFTPSLIILMTSTGNGNMSCSMFSSFNDPLGFSSATKISLYNSNLFSNSPNHNLSHIAIAGGYRLPVTSQSATYTWYAYE
ncbi:hypothetical protein [Lysinibacillus sp. NPDC047702]|uniref:hypothetical protein n=1 Tax=unclassified Lysinibacillus TaxID=2636778 RepID=UPI003D08F8ED